MEFYYDARLSASLPHLNTLLSYDKTNYCCFMATIVVKIEIKISYYLLLVSTAPTTNHTSGDNVRRSQVKARQTMVFGGTSKSNITCSIASFLNS